jgi:hypothetical protein
VPTREDGENHEKRSKLIGGLRGHPQQKSIIITSSGHPSFLFPPPSFPIHPSFIHFYLRTKELLAHERGHLRELLGRVC